MLLYHYCSNLAFCSIIEQKRVRLSLLSLSNDAKEGQHVLDVASRVLPGDFVHKEDALAQLKQVISLISAIGFCVSEDGDLLSQWRGYADDARGIAIGFDRDALRAAAEEESGEDFIVRLAPVGYDEKLLTEVILPDLNPIVEHYNLGKMNPPRCGTLLMPLTEEELEAEQLRYQKASNDLFRMLFRIANYAYMVKALFFKEEKEWRLFSLLTTSDKGLMLSNARFQPSSDKLKPFREFPLKGFAPNIVKEIVLGPRNLTPIEVARLFLDSQGFDHVLLRRSIGSYR